jgi:hypothetical protein
MCVKPALIIVITVLNAIAIHATQLPASGSVGGRITDREGSSLPGVRVAVRGAAGPRESITNENGEFVVDPLPPGDYDLTAQLPGFQTRSVPAITVLPAERTTVSVMLDLGCRVEFVYVDLGVRETLRIAAAAVHLRIRNWTGPQRIEGDRTCHRREYTALVLGIAKPARGVTAGKELRVYTRDLEQVFERDGEVIAFLERSSAGDYYIEPHYTFPVRNGRVVWDRDSPGKLAVIPVTDVLSRLRAMVRR